MCVYIHSTRVLIIILFKRKSSSPRRCYDRTPFLLPSAVHARESCVMRYILQTRTQIIFDPTSKAINSSESTQGTDGRLCSMYRTSPLYPFRRCLSYGFNAFIWWLFERSCVQRSGDVHVFVIRCYPLWGGRGKEGDRNVDVERKKTFQFLFWVFPVSRGKKKKIRVKPNRVERLFFLLRPKREKKIK